MPRTKKSLESLAGTLKGVPPPPEAGGGNTPEQDRLMQAIVDQGQRLQKEQGVKAEVKDGSVSYVECDHGGCAGPAIWIHASNPLGDLGKDDWSASYKPKGIPWPAEIKPHCQCCEARHGGKRRARTLTIYSGTGKSAKAVGMRAASRFVRTITKEEYEQLVPQEQTNG